MTILRGAPLHALGNHNQSTSSSRDRLHPVSGSPTASAADVLAGQPEAYQPEALPTNGTFGVDRLVLTYRLDEREAGPAVADKYRGKGLQIRQQPSVHVATRNYNGLRYVRVDFNPSRFRDPDGSSLCTAEQAKQIADLVLYDLEVTSLPMLARTDVRVARLDIARDFVVNHPSRWIDAMRSLRAKYARDHFGYFDAEGKLQSVTSGSKSTKMKLYDKAAHRRDCSWAQKYNLRWEAQISTAAACGKEGFDTPDRLTSERLYRAALRLWGKSRCGEARIRPTVVEYVHALDYSGLDKAVLIGLYESLRQQHDWGLRNTEWYQMLYRHDLRTRRGRITTPRGTTSLDFALGSERPVQMAVN